MKYIVLSNDGYFKFNEKPPSGWDENDLEWIIARKILRHLEQVSKIDAWQDDPDTPVFTENHRFDYLEDQQAVMITNKQDYFDYANELVKGNETNDQAAIRAYKEDNAKLLEQIAPTIAWLKRQPEIAIIYFTGLTSGYPDQDIFKRRK